MMYLAAKTLADPNTLLDSQYIDVQTTRPTTRIVYCTPSLQS